MCCRLQQQEKKMHAVGEKLNGHGQVFVSANIADTYLLAEAADL